MIGTIDVCLNAHNPNFPLEPVFTFVNSSQSFRVRNVPKKIGKWNITNVTVNVSYPDNTIVSKECVLTGGVWVATVNGCSTSGTCENGFVVTASGIDENEQVVSNYVLGAGNLFVKELDGTVTPGKTAIRMFFYETVPNNPNEGDTTFQNGVLKVYDGTNWKPCYEQDLSQYYTKTEVDNKLQVKRDLTDMTVDLGTTYDSWFLSNLYGNDFNPPIELKWTTFVWNGSGEYTGWVATTDNWSTYYCLLPELTMLFWFNKEEDGSYTAGYGEDVTLSSDELAIATINGDPNNITCTRQSKDPIPVTTSLATVNDIPTKTSDLTNDSDFITSTQVEPYVTLAGYAKKAQMSLGTATINTHNNGTEFPVYLFTIEDGITPRGALQRQYLKDWNLTRYDQTTYSTPLKMVWQYMDLKRIRNGRQVTVYQGYGWLSDTDNDGKRYAIGCANVKNTADPDCFYYNDGTGSEFGVRKTLTLSANELSIESLEGGTSITCIRQSKYWATSSTYLAIVDDIPTKTSDLTNDSGFVAASNPVISNKRNLLDMNVRGTPTSEGSWFNINDGTYMENAYWYDGTRWMTGATFEVDITSTTGMFELKQNVNSEWISFGTFSLDNNYEATLVHDGVTYTIVGYVSELATQHWVLEQLSALQTRIAALENNT